MGALRERRPFRRPDSSTAIFEGYTHRDAGVLRTRSLLQQQLADATDRFAVDELQRVLMTLLTSKRGTSWDATDGGRLLHGFFWALDVK